MSSFVQEGPSLQNTYVHDSVLQGYLKSRFVGTSFQNLFDHLTHCGELAATTWLQWANQAEEEHPVHIPYDTWGTRIDDIRMSSGWKNLEKAAATEGVVATAYQRKQGDLSRLYQMSLLYLFHSSSAFVSCPLAMTDGAAFCLMKFGGESSKFKEVFQHLTSNDANQMWTSGQWMTEKIGGSDVSQTETLAHHQAGKASLYGLKWFTSATTAEVALTLARDVDAQGKTVPGSKGLSMYLVQLRDEKKRLRNITVNRLKEKLGTKALPTAELTLQGTPADAVGGHGNGVKKITSMLNITRIYNSVCATSHARRALDLAKDFSTKRSAFGRKIAEHPMHQETLRTLEENFQKCFYLTFYIVELLGKDECGTITQEESALLRLLTPLVKLFTGKKSMAICSEAVESFGGTGYIENSGMPTLLRDAQVFSIWEGTTNILCLDFIRALSKDQLWPVLEKWVQLAEQKNNQMHQDKSLFNFRYHEVQNAVQIIHQMKAHLTDEIGLQTYGRQLCFSLAEVFAFLTKHGFLTAHPRV